MYIHLGLRQALSHTLITELEDMETEFGVPIRILNGSGVQQTTPHDWDGHTEHSHEDEAEQVGLTLFDYGAPGPVDYYNAEALWPPAEYQRRTGQVHSGTVRDALTLLDVDGADELVAETIKYTDGNDNRNPLLWIGDRTVWSAVYLQQIGQYGESYFHFTNLIRDALTKAQEVSGSEDYATRAERREAQKFDRFVSYHKDAPERGLRVVRTEITEHEYEYQRVQSRLVGVIQQLEQARQRAVVIESMPQPGEDELKSEWERLNSHPRINEFDFPADNQLVITTKDVTLHHPEGDYEALMGRFKINANLIDGTITFENLDSPRGGRPHPHVLDDGVPCFGELQHAVQNLLQEGKYIGFIEYCLEFLESYNPQDDWGRYARRWIEHPHIPSDNGGSA